MIRRKYRDSIGLISRLYIPKCEMRFVVYAKSVYYSFFFFFFHRVLISSHTLGRAKKYMNSHTVMNFKENYISWRVKYNYFSSHIESYYIAFWWYTHTHIAFIRIITEISSLLGPCKKLSFSFSAVEHLFQHCLHLDFLSIDLFTRHLFTHVYILFVRFHLNHCLATLRS